VAKNLNFYPVILAGGRGTRFWPLSRKKRAKQLLALDGKQTMIQQTVARLLPLAAAKQFWIITNDDGRSAIAKQLPKLPKAQILAEPVGRNTAPAIGLAAFLLLRENPDAVLGLFPSDHVIGDQKRYRGTLGRGIEIAAVVQGPENVRVLIVSPAPRDDSILPIEPVCNLTVVGDRLEDDVIGADFGDLHHEVAGLAFSSGEMDRAQAARFEPKARGRDGTRETHAEISRQFRVEMHGRR